MKKILITAPYFIKEIDKLKRYLNDFDLIIPNVIERFNEDELLDIYNKYPDIVGTICGDDEYTKGVLDSSNKLKVISKWGTGIDSIDKEYAESIGIKVKNTLDAFTEPVSQTTIGLILSLIRGIHENNMDMKNGKWYKTDCFSLDELTVGVIGHGRIGKRVSSILNVMGANVIINDIKYKRDQVIVNRTSIPIVNDRYKVFKLDDLLKLSDIVTIHCDLNETSYHLINKETINMMKNGSILINTARGKIIKEDDLIYALKNEKIKSCGLDVYENEPLKDSELLKMDNVIKLSHNSNNSRKYWDKVHQNTIKNLIENI